MDRVTRRITQSRAFWRMHQKVNVCLYSNIGTPEVYCNIYTIGAPAFFGYLCPGSHDKHQFEHWLSRQEQEHFMLFGKWQRMFIGIEYNMV